MIKFCVFPHCSHTHTHPVFHLISQFVPANLFNSMCMGEKRRGRAGKSAQTEQQWRRRDVRIRFQSRNRGTHRGGGQRKVRRRQFCSRPERPRWRSVWELNVSGRKDGNAPAAGVEVLSSKDPLSADEVGPPLARLKSTSNQALATARGFWGQAAFGDSRGRMLRACLVTGVTYGWTADGGFAETWCNDCEAGPGRERIFSDLLGTPLGAVVHFCSGSATNCSASWRTTSTRGLDGQVSRTSRHCNPVCSKFAKVPGSTRRVGKRGFPRRVRRHPVW